MLKWSFWPLSGVPDLLATRGEETFLIDGGNGDLRVVREYEKRSTRRGAPIIVTASRYTTMAMLLGKISPQCPL